METGWRALLSSEYEAPYFLKLKSFLDEEKRLGYTVYPPRQLVFNAFKQTPLDSVKVVILGQDPYHGPGQAHGLAFSVPKGMKPPPSLQNIFKELQQDLGIPNPGHGDLQNWARQGVLLLNTVLTVRAETPQSHAKRGWEIFTDQVIRHLSAKPGPGLIFVLWGSSAQQKIPLIDAQRHSILTAAHPSPLSAHRGFLGCRHFSKINQLLRAEGVPEIDWRL